MSHWMEGSISPYACAIVFNRAWNCITACHSCACSLYNQTSHEGNFPFPTLSLRNRSSRIAALVIAALHAYFIGGVARYNPRDTRERETAHSLIHHESRIYVPRTLGWWVADWHHHRLNEQLGQSHAKFTYQIPTCILSRAVRICHHKGCCYAVSSQRCTPRNHSLLPQQYSLKTTGFWLSRIRVVIRESVMSGIAMNQTAVNGNTCPLPSSAQAITVV